MKPGYTFSCVVGIYSSGHVLLAGLPAPFVTDEQCPLDGGQGTGTIIMIDSKQKGIKYDLPWWYAAGHSNSGSLGSTVMNLSHSGPNSLPLSQHLLAL